MPPLAADSPGRKRPNTRKLALGAQTAHACWSAAVASRYACRACSAEHEEGILHDDNHELHVDNLHAQAAARGLKSWPWPPAPRLRDKRDPKFGEDTAVPAGANDIPA